MSRVDWAVEEEPRPDAAPYAAPLAAPVAAEPLDRVFDGTANLAPQDPVVGHDPAIVPAPVDGPGGPLVPGPSGEFRCDHARVRLPVGWTVPAWADRHVGWLSRTLDERWTLVVRAGWWDRRTPPERIAADFERTAVETLYALGIVGVPTVTIQPTADAIEIRVAATGRRLVGATLLPFALAYAVRLAPGGQVAMLDLYAELGAAEGVTDTVLAALLADLEILRVAAPEEAPWDRDEEARAAHPAPEAPPARGLQVRRAALRPDAPTGRPRPWRRGEEAKRGEPPAVPPEPEDHERFRACLYFVPAGRFLPDPELPEFPARADAPATAPASPDEPAPARPPPPAPTQPPKRPSALLPLAALAPALTFFLTYVQIRLRDFGLFYEQVELSGADLAAHVPLAWAIPAHAVAATLVARHWRADPLARWPRWALGVGAPVMAGVTVVVAAHANVLTGRAGEPSIGVFGAGLAYLFVLGESLLHRPR